MQLVSGYITRMTRPQSASAAPADPPNPAAAGIGAGAAVPAQAAPAPRTTGPNTAVPNAAASNTTVPYATVLSASGSAGSGSAGLAPGAAPSDSRALTDTVSRLRRALRRSIRTDYPWDAAPMAQIEVLQSLAEVAPTRIRDLAARLNLSPSTVSSLVGQMIGTGLVERGIDRRDRRVAVVEPTAAGRRQLAQWNIAHERRIAVALEQLTLAERSVIAAALPALARLVDELNATPGPAAGTPRS